MNAVHPAAAPKRTFPALTLTLFSALGWGCTPLIGDGDEVAQTREVGAFRRLAVHSGIRASFSPGVRAVEVAADKNLLPHLETVVEGETLIIRLSRDVLVLPTSTLQASVSGEELVELSASGGARIDAAVPASGEEPFRLSGSGGSWVVARGVSAPRLELNASGGSHLTAEGQSPTLHLEASGGSRLTTDAVDAETVELQGSGGSQLTARARGSVEGTLSGGSRAVVFGQPARRAVNGGPDGAVSYP